MRARPQARPQIRVSVAVVAAGLALLSACGSDATPVDQSGSASGGPSAAPGSGDYAFDVDRDGIAEAVTAAFASDGGSARWDGDTLVLTVDGDADATMAGFTQCMTLSHLLAVDDASVVEFPNGRVDCDDVLP